MVALVGARVHIPRSDIAFDRCRLFFFFSPNRIGVASNGRAIVRSLDRPAGRANAGLGGSGTINLDEAVYRRIMELAHSHEKSLARTIEDLLRSSFAKGPQPVVELPLHCDNGSRPGIDIADRDRLYDLMEGR